MVQRLRFVQRAPTARPTARPAPRPAAPPTLPERIDTALAEIPDEALRAALAKLGRGVYRNSG